MARSRAVKLVDRDPRLKLWREEWNRLKESVARWIGLCFVQSAIAAIGITGATSDDREVVFSELLYDASDDGCEFVEVWNHGAELVDVSGWQLAGGVRFHFPRGSELDPGGYLVVAGDRARFERRFEQTVSVAGEWEGRLRNEGEKIKLLDARGRPVDDVSYRPGFLWPASLPGRSIELIHPAMDNSKGGAWRVSDADLGATPGGRNSRSVDSPLPVIESVSHSPRQPKSGESLRIEANLEQADLSPRSVELCYQIVEAGAFVPAVLPQRVSSMRRYGVEPLQANPAFEAEDAWTVVPMEMNGGVYVGEIPGQLHRTLVRYRVAVRTDDDVLIRAPQLGDPNENFAAFVCDGVPDYEVIDSEGGDVRVYPSNSLTKLPVYWLITRAEDYSQCMAYSKRSRLRKGSDASRSYNWEGAFVYEGRVYDHIRYRLRGGNGRYLGNGKRSMKFRFNPGNFLEARDQRGKQYERGWRVLECSKGFSNRMVGNFGMVDSINGKLWRMVGVPAPLTHWFHYRVVDGVVEAPDQWRGDFHGMLLAQEHYDGGFLEQHDLEKGDLFKLSDGVWDPESQLRYRAPGSPEGFSNYEEIEGMTDWNSAKWIRERVDIDKWARFSAVKEAVRHYDFWPGANKNMVYYFAPGGAGTDASSTRLWLLPYDHDDTWGPCWNHGQDVVTSAVQDKYEILLQERNVVREFRDLLWQSDQLNPMLDDLARTIAGFVEADYARWWRAPVSEGQEYYGTLEEKLADMKGYAWYGGHWRGGSVGLGGRARYLDEYAGDPAIPTTPEVRYTGGSGYPADGLKFESSLFESSGEAPFKAVAWRLAVITPPSTRIDPFSDERDYEWDADWSRLVERDGEAIHVPAGIVREGDLCRVRGRHLDSSGRWSHWSRPVEFVASAPSISRALALAITEIHYDPAASGASEPYEGKDLEWIEVTNVGAERADLEGVRFTKGVRFRFSEGTSLTAGERVIVAGNLDAFRWKYGDSIEVAGQWEQGAALSNGGERVQIVDRAGVTLSEVTYDDRSPWVAEADGLGATLELKPSALKDPPVDLSDPTLWQGGRDGGSPGAP